MRQTRDSARACPKGRRKLEFDTQKHALPLLNKAVYMDMKHCKLADLMEEQLKKLGARVEKFLSGEVNYVISSSGPSKADDRTVSREENPNSPNVSSPFNCGPSPAGQPESRAAVVSRGKALAQIACAKNKASTVVANAEKLGIKVLSTEVASKWLEKEVKKLKCVKEKPIKEQSKAKKTERKQKENKTKSKLLKGSFVKFEDISRHYRPVKLELEKWPKLNLLVPPGICPFGEAKMKVQHHYVARNLQPQINAVACGPVPVKEEQAVAQLVEEVVRPTHRAAAEFVGVPIATTGDARNILNCHLKKNLAINKQQGYCDCCGVKFQNIDEHINGEEHRSFSRQKSNYESLDALINQVPSTASFLQSVLLKHCAQKQGDTSLTSCPADSLVIVEPLSPLTTEKTHLVSPEATCLKTPDPSGLDLSMLKDKVPVTDTDLISRPETSTTKTEKLSHSQPQAVVIRRPTPSGLFTSPRRRQLTPSKKPWMQECSMVFRDSPIASLQPFCSSDKNCARFLSDSTLDTKYKKVQMSGNCLTKLEAGKPKLKSDEMFSSLLSHNFANLNHDFQLSEVVRSEKTDKTQSTGVSTTLGVPHCSVRRSLNAVQALSSQNSKQVKNKVKDTQQEQTVGQIAQEADVKRTQSEEMITQIISPRRSRRLTEKDTSLRTINVSKRLFPVATHRDTSENMVLNKEKAEQESSRRRPCPLLVPGSVHQAEQESSRRNPCSLLVPGSVHQAEEESSRRSPCPLLVPGSVHQAEQESSRRNPCSLLVPGSVHQAEQESSRRSPCPLLVPGSVHQAEQESSRRNPCSLLVPGSVHQAEQESSRRSPCSLQVPGSVHQAEQESSRRSPCSLLVPGSVHQAEQESSRRSPCPLQVPGSVHQDEKETNSHQKTAKELRENREVVEALSQSVETFSLPCAVQGVVTAQDKLDEGSRISQLCDDSGELVIEQDKLDEGSRISQLCDDSGQLVIEQDKMDEGSRISQLCDDSGQLAIAQDKLDEGSKRSQLCDDSEKIAHDKLDEGSKRSQLCDDSEKIAHDKLDEGSKRSQLCDDSEKIAQDKLDEGSKRSQLCDDSEKIAQDKLDEGSESSQCCDDAGELVIAQDKLDEGSENLQLCDDAGELVSAQDKLDEGSENLQLCDDAGELVIAQDKLDEGSESLQLCDDTGELVIAQDKLDEGSENLQLCDDAGELVSAQDKLDEGSENLQLCDDAGELVIAQDKLDEGSENLQLCDDAGELVIVQDKLDEGSENLQLCDDAGELVSAQDKLDEGSENLQLCDDAGELVSAQDKLDEGSENLQLCDDAGELVSAQDKLDEGSKRLQLCDDAGELVSAQDKLDEGSKRLQLCDDAGELVSAQDKLDEGSKRLQLCDDAGELVSAQDKLDEGSESQQCCDDSGKLVIAQDIPDEGTNCKSPQLCHDSVAVSRNRISVTLFSDHPQQSDFEQPTLLEEMAVSQSRNLELYNPHESSTQCTENLVSDTIPVIRCDTVHQCIGEYCVNCQETDEYGSSEVDVITTVVSRSLSTPQCGEQTTNLPELLPVYAENDGLKVACASNADCCVVADKEGSMLQKNSESKVDLLYSEDNKLGDNKLVLEKCSIPFAAVSVETEAAIETVDGRVSESRVANEACDMVVNTTAEDIICDKQCPSPNHKANTSHELAHLINSDLSLPQLILQDMVERNISEGSVHGSESKLPHLHKVMNTLHTTSHNLNLSYGNSSSTLKYGESDDDSSLELLDNLDMSLPDVDLEETSQRNEANRNHLIAEKSTDQYLSADKHAQLRTMDKLLVTDDKSTHYGDKFPVDGKSVRQGMDSVHETGATNLLTKFENSSSIYRRNDICKLSSLDDCGGETREQVAAGPDREQVAAGPDSEQVAAGPDSEQVAAGPDSEQVAAGPDSGVPGMVVVPNIADRVKRRSRPVGLPSQSDFDKKEKAEKKERRKRKKRSVKIKSDNKLSRGNIERLDRLSHRELTDRRGQVLSRHVTPETEQVGGKASRQVHPKSAESVKRRRSCTYFNHVGQYAECDGDGSDGENTKTGAQRVQNYRHRSCSKQERMSENGKHNTGITKHLSVVLSRHISTERNTSESNDLNPRKLKAYRKLSSKSEHRDQADADSSSAVVIRRRKSGTYPVFTNQKRPEVDWGSLHQDGFSDQDQDDDSVVRDEALLSCGRTCNNQPNSVVRDEALLSCGRTCNNQSNSVSSPNGQSCCVVDTMTQQKALVREATVSLVDISRTGTSPHLTDSDTLVTHRARYKKQKLATARSHASTSDDSQPPEAFPSLVSSPGMASSPRLRLKIRRQPDNKGFSSTLEEIHYQAPTDSEEIHYQAPTDSVSVKDFHNYTNKDGHCTTNQPFASEYNPGQDPNASSSDNLHSLSQSQPADFMKSSSSNVVNSFKKKKHRKDKRHNPESGDSPVKCQSSKKRAKLSLKNIQDVCSTDVNKLDAETDREEIPNQQNAHSTCLTNPLPKVQAINHTLDHRPHSPCFSSPVSSKRKHPLATPKKQSSGQPVSEQQSPVFKMFRKSVKHKQESHNSTPKCFRNVLPQTDSHLSSPALKLVCLEDNVHLDNSTVANSHTAGQSHDNSTVANSHTAGQSHDNSTVANSHTAGQSHGFKRTGNQHSLDFPSAKRVKLDRPVAASAKELKDSVSFVSLGASPGHAGSSQRTSSSASRTDSKSKELAIDVENDRSGKLDSAGELPGRQKVAHSTLSDRTEVAHSTSSDRTEVAHSTSSNRTEVAHSTSSDRTEVAHSTSSDSTEVEHSTSSDSTEVEHEDSLIQVPTFSSPDKATDSSWGDICDSYLSTSISKYNHQPSMLAEKSPISKYNHHSSMLAGKSPISKYNYHSSMLAGKSPISKYNHHSSMLAGKSPISKYNYHSSMLAGKSPISKYNYHSSMLAGKSPISKPSKLAGKSPISKHNHQPSMLTGKSPTSKPSKLTGKSPTSKPSKLTGKSPTSKYKRDSTVSPSSTHLTSSPAGRTPRIETQREQNIPNKEDDCKQTRAGNTGSVPPALPGETDGGSSIDSMHLTHGRSRNKLQTPVKNSNVRNSETNSGIERVDDVVSFNHMSPQRLHFSPQRLNFTPQRLNFSPQCGGGYQESDSLRRPSVSSPVDSARVRSSTHRRGLYSPSKRYNSNHLCSTLER